MIPLHAALDADKLEQAKHFFAHGAFGQAAVVRADGLGDLPADRDRRVQSGHRVLKYHRKHAAAQLAHLALAVIGDVRAVYINPARADARRRRQKLHDSLAQHAFAAARFADDRQYLAAGKRERHAAHGLNFTARRVKADRQIFNTEQLAHVFAPSFWRIAYDSIVHSAMFQKMPTPWWPMTVSASMPEIDASAT